MTLQGKGFTNEQGTVDIRAPGSLFAWAGKCVSAGPATIPLGAVTVSHCRNSENPYQFEHFNEFRGPPDAISFDMIAPKWKVALFERRLMTCKHDIRKRWSTCLVPNNLDSWELIEDYLDVYIEQITESGGTVGIDEAGANILETFATKATCRDVLWRITPSRVGEAVTTLAINAVRWCSPFSCGEPCGDLSDGCQVFRAVTDSGLSYLDTPYLITATRDGFSWAFAYVAQPIDPWNAGAEHALDLVCLSEGRVIAISNAAIAAAYSDDGGANWIEVLLNAGGPPNAIEALSRTEIIIVGDNGYIYRSGDAGVTFDVVDPGTTLTADLMDVHGLGLVWAVVGEGNEFGVSNDGGYTWDAILGPNPGADLQVVRVFSDQEILVGCDDGTIWRTTDQGATWEEVVDFAALLGAAATVDEWDFCGCRADKGGVIVNSGGIGYVYRTIDHAMTFDRLRDKNGTILPLPDNLGVNGIACCDPNVFVAVGEAEGGSGYMALIK